MQFRRILQLWYNTSLNIDLIKGIWQYIFLFFHCKELFKLYVNLLYRFCVTILFLEIFWLKIIYCPPSWINFYLIIAIGDFSDVISRVSHIKLHLNDQITLSLVWKVVRQFFISNSYRSMDKILAWPCLWCHMHIRQNPRWRKASWFVIFSVQISQEIIKFQMK
jgi:hypothetical protein